jgi:D-alanine-D-alanine ligase
MALDAFKLLKVRDFARIDIKTNDLGECFFMEANLVPGLTAGTSYFPKAFKMSHGFSYDSVIRLLIDGGISRVASTLTVGKDYCLGDKIPMTTLTKKFLNRCSQMLNPH